MRQLTILIQMILMITISKLPMRQLTFADIWRYGNLFSKLPMRQLTRHCYKPAPQILSKLPMRQLTRQVHILPAVIQFLNYLCGS